MFEHENKYHAGAVSPPGYAGFDMGQAEMGPPQIVPPAINTSRSSGGKRHTRPDDRRYVN